jgi:glycosyltransferase involved in cell wall biosynthesis
MNKGSIGLETGIPVSIVTICKNSAATMARTMESVFAQKITGLEYIIIDGGSIDGTLEIIRSFGNRISVLVSEQDSGISEAFNKGIAHANGSIVGLINSDDVLLPGTLQKVLDFYALNPHVEVMHGDVLFYDGDCFIKRIAPPPLWWLPWRMGTFNIHPATFVRRDVYARCGCFDTSYRYAMDDDLYLRWLDAGIKIAYLPEPLVRVAAGGLSGRDAYQVFMEKRKALVKHGRSRILADIQCLTRCLGQLVVMLQNSWRRHTKANAISGNNGT